MLNWCCLLSTLLHHLLDELGRNEGATSATSSCAYFAVAQAHLAGRLENSKASIAMTKSTDKNEDLSGLGI